ncbi:MAG: hypothetical protein Q7K26_06205 [bacterium]|nr:hypothetical protein [bacterium]
MSQSRRGSFIENLVVMAGSLVISILAQTFLFPLFGVYVPGISTNLYLTLILGVVGFSYKYMIRRVFNARE